MDPRQIKLIQTSFATIQPESDRVARLFYGRLFELEPSLRSLFAENMELQEYKLMTTLYTIVQNLDDLEKVIPALQVLGLRHQAYGIEASHYELVEGVLIWSFKRKIGEEFTPELEEAWRMAYRLVTGVMQQNIG